MKKLLTMALAATLTVGVISPASAETTLNGNGSSYVNSLMQSCKDGAVKVNYLAAGSGSGRTQFLNKSVDFGASDVPYGPTETKPDFAYGYIPLAGGPIAIAFNIPGVSNLRLTNKVISDIYLGKITKWNSKAIADLNPKAKLPNIRINPVSRADSSGTSANLANYLSATVGAGWIKDTTTFNLANKSKVVGLSAPKSLGVLTLIKQTQGSIGYLDLADVRSQGIPYAYVQNGAGQFVKPTPANAALFINVQKVGSNGIVSFDYNKKVLGGYNLSLVSYAIVPLVKTEKSDAIKTFFNYLVNQCAPANANMIGFSQISNNVKVYARKTISLIGTK